MQFKRPSKFNDPFDCDPEMDEHEHLNYAKDLIKKAGDDLGLSPAGLMVKGVETALQNRELSQNLADNVGICSLSRDPLNLLMWAHYAKDHTGFVVEFCIPTHTKKFREEDALKRLTPLEVKYEKTKPIVNPYEEYRVLCEKYFLVKGDDWIYEQEERVVDSLRGPGIHPYERKVILKSVIAGMRMCDDHLAILKNTVEAMNAELGINVAVYKAEPLKGKFALSVPGRDDLSSNPARTHA